MTNRDDDLGARLPPNISWQISPRYFSYTFCQCPDVSGAVAGGTAAR
jgi:hypothetical protein